MAKASGSTRASRWRSSDNKDKLYYRDGVRVEYSELDEPGKKLVKDAKKK